MKILYDYQAFMQEYGGVSNSFVQLIKHLPDSIDYKIAIDESDNVHLKNSGLADVSPMKDAFCNFISKNHFKGKGRLYNLYSQLFPNKTSYGRNKQCSIEALKYGSFDVFHPTFFDDYFLHYIQDKPFVLTIHDMIPERLFSKMDHQDRNKRMLCYRASHIIAVSEKTKSDMIDIFHVPEKKVTVIYHGAPDGYNDIAQEPIIYGDYILYVGQRGAYKNFMPMVKALKHVLQTHPKMKIVCTGPDFSVKERKELQTFGISDRIIHHQVDDNDMQNLYAHALCFIYPSKYEGFGIPILEAYRANCPVLLNHASCFPEIAQDAALFFHLDESGSDLGDTMERFLAMEQRERNILIQKQCRRLDSFSWERSAKKLADIYSSII